jgi:hypothetical protein
VRPRLRHGAALALLGVALAGCGGGGGGGESAELPPAGAALPPAMGATPDQSAVQALAALGMPAGVSASEADETLSRLDTFGLPHDLFDAKIEPAAEPAVTTPTVPVAPVVPVVPTVPVVPSAPTMPTSPVAGTTPTTPTTPTTSTAEAVTPTGSALTKEDADAVVSLSISGEAVLARVGDAVPPDSQEIVVAAIDGDAVVLRLVRGLLPDGTDRVTLRVGQSMTLTDGLLGRTYTVKLLEVLPAE